MRPRRKGMRVRGTAQLVAGYGPGPSPNKKRPYIRRPRVPAPPAVVNTSQLQLGQGSSPLETLRNFRMPKTTTHTMTGTGVTSATGGQMPGAPPSRQNINYETASPAQIAQSMLE